MTREEIIDGLEVYTVGRLNKARVNITVEELQKFINAIEALEQQSCEMTAEEYRQRMIQAFHNADAGELVAVCVLPTEKEFDHLEWLLKNHYKKDPCEDCVSRQTVLEQTYNWSKDEFLRVTNPFDYLRERINSLPPVTPQKKIGRWIRKLIRNEHGGCIGAKMLCSECGEDNRHDEYMKFCPNCGIKMQEVEE